MERAMVSGVVLDYSKYSLYRLSVYTVDLLFTPPLACDEVAPLQRLQVMAYHTLLLAQGFSKSGDIHGVIPKCLEYCQARWVG